MYVFCCFSSLGSEMRQENHQDLQRDKLSA